LSQSTDLQTLIAAAHQAVREGRADEARRLWEHIAVRTPDDPQAPYVLGFLALQQGQPATARDHLRRSVALRPDDKLAQMTLAVALRETGDIAAELEALMAALAVDPYFLPALLSLGAYQERRGQHRVAAATYANALKIVPDERGWPGELRDHLAHARRVRDRNAEAYHAYLQAETAAAREQHPGADFARLDQGMAIMAGVSKPYFQEPVAFLVPRLPAIPFYDRADFPFLRELEAATATIREELLAGLNAMEGFVPYVRYAPGVPVNQWADLNYSDRWSTLFLWLHGAPVPEAHARFPKTAAILKTMAMADIDGLCPTAMFSALAPHTTIPPHSGETNARLVVHLPLVVPENCLYRVGAEERQWVEGECLIFDDSIEHAAHNGSDELRIVLIFDVWNPLLSAAERDMVRAAMAARRDYYAT
jgi:aspartyl/asparaginyl beta-hydroxylase (cupin superfamily)